MPPIARRSRRSKRPSTQALEVSASKPAKRARKSGTGANPSSESYGGGAISEDLISAIVTRVTAEVTRQLKPTSSGHSFRIGAASRAAEHRLTDTQIRLLGRWKSNAFTKYIRVPSLSS